MENRQSSSNGSNGGTFETFRAMAESPEVRTVFEGILPPQTNVDAWLSSAIVAVQGSRDVEQATPESTVGALITAASLGLRLEGVLGQAYLTAIKIYDKSKRDWTVQAYHTQLQIGYMGLIRMALKNPQVLDCEARVVCQDDTFRFGFGTDHHLQHTWDHKRPRGPIVAVYAALRYRRGFYKYSDPYDISEIYDVQLRALRGKGIIPQSDGKGGTYWCKEWQGKQRRLKPDELDRIPWIARFRAMAQKTAVRWASKFWNLGETFDAAASLVGMDDSGVSQELAGVTQRYLGDARRARRDNALSAGVGDWSAEPEAPAAPRPFDGAQGASLKDRMLAEALHGAPASGDPPPDEQAAILEQERAEAAAAARAAHPDGEDD
jgi:phage RecT family recombinase